MNDKSNIPPAVTEFAVQERAKLLSDNADLRARLAKYEDAEGRIYWNTRAQLPSQGGEAVAWQRWHGDYHELGYSRLTDDQKSRGWQERPLYTHPADQVAGGVAVSRELRSVLAMILNALDRDAAEGKQVRREMAEELRALMEVKP